MYDLIIIGGGPAGVAAGVYAARKKIKPLLITESFGGQSIVSADIQNWIGVKSISGFELAKNLEEHLRSQEGIEIVEGELAAGVSKIDSGFRVITKSGKSFDAKTILVTSGSRRRRLGVPGEDKFDGRGVAYCSICDAPVFKGKDVAVVGGGNAGLEAVVDLFPYAKSICILERNGGLKGDAVTQEKVKSNPKAKVILGAETQEIVGDDFVKALRYKDLASGEVKEIPVQGVFVEIGIVPNSEFVKGLVQISPFGEIVVDPRTQRTSVEGIWAAGDVTDSPYRQNNISAGEAVKAVLNIYDYLTKSV